jgi:hypothetical protein
MLMFWEFSVVRFTIVLVTQTGYVTFYLTAPTTTVGREKQASN